LNHLYGIGVLLLEIVLILYACAAFYSWGYKRGRRDEYNWWFRTGKQVDEVGERIRREK
jgi:hypothetical protein